MRPLTSTDALFLATENRRAPSNISSLAMLDRRRSDGTELTVDHIRQLFAERLHLLPPLGWQLVEPPFGFSHPWWIDVEVDLEFHVRELAVPPPADQRAFTDLVARIAAQPMDRSRPLWEVYFVQNAPEGRAALLTKLHHAAMDGVSGAEAMSVLLDGDPAGRELPPAEPRQLDRPPRQLDLIARSLIGLPKRQVEQVAAARRALPHIDRVPQVRSVPGVRTASSLARSTVGNRIGDDTAPAPRMRFNAEISARRRLELVTLSLPEVKRLKRTFGTTVNDVLVAVCAGALRTWLDDAGELPEDPMVAMIPVSIRSPEEAGTFGNAVAALIAPLPTDVDDPRVRLESCRDELNQAKERFLTTPANLIRDANDMLPPALFGPAMRTVLRLGSSRLAEPVANLVISNVPGSRSPLYCCGAEVVAHYPVSVLADSLGLNITLFSYQDRLDVGLIADPGLVPELGPLGDAMVAELARFVELAEQQEGDGP